MGILNCCTLRNKNETIVLVIKRLFGKHITSRLLKTQNSIQHPQTNQSHYNIPSILLSRLYLKDLYRSEAEGQSKGLCKCLVPSNSPEAPTVLILDLQLGNLLPRVECYQSVDNQRYRFFFFTIIIIVSKIHLQN